MEGIRPLWTQMPLQSRFRVEAASDTDAARRGEAAREAASFTDIFRNAIDAVKETDAERVETEYLLSTGQLDNPVWANIASTKASLSVDLLVQLRSRVMDAYNELMRISL